MTPNLTQNDVDHLKEISTMYYPERQSLEFEFDSHFVCFYKALLDYNKGKRNPHENVDSNSRLPVADHSQVSKPLFKLYRCCNISTSSYKESVDHWYNSHYIPATINSKDTITTFYGSIPRVEVYYKKACNSLEDVGNTSLSLSERTTYLLKQIKHAPTNTFFFRPISFAVQNLRNTNPYSEAFLSAYDFLDTVTQQPAEYQYFLSRLFKDNEVKHLTDTFQDHLPFYPLWYNYCSPTISCTKKQTRELSQEGAFSLETHKSSKRIKFSHASNMNFHQDKRTVTQANAVSIKLGLIDPIPKLRNSQKKEDVPLIRCKNFGCHKVYKQLNGLRYHLEQGRCTTVRKEIISRRCPFLPCDQGFSVVEGLKLHIKKCHLTPRKSENKMTLTSKCTMCKNDSKTFHNCEELITHIIKNHVSLSTN